MVFDNVFVPWEHVFIYRNVEICARPVVEDPAHSLGNHQAQVRYVTKLRFMPGLAQRMNEMTGNAAQPPVQIMMGELAALAIDLRIHAARAGDRGADRGRRAVAVAVTLYSAMAMQSEFNGRMLEMIRELAGARLHHAAVVGRRFRQPGDRRRHRALYALGVDRRQDARRADAAALGFPRLRIRQPPPAIREILRRRLVPGEAERLPQFRLQARDGAWSMRR